MLVRGDAAILVVWLCAAAAKETAPRCSLRPIQEPGSWKPSECVTSGKASSLAR